MSRIHVSFDMIWTRGSEGPDHGDKDARHEPDPDIERNTELQIVDKSVATRSVNEEVGLITDGSGIAGGCAEADPDNERSGVDAEACGHGQGDRDEQHRSGIIA